MATFYGGEQLQSIVTLYTDSSFNDPSYTIPSGRYAVVEYAGRKSTNGTLAFNASRSGSLFFTDSRDGVSVNNPFSGTVYLDEGDTLQIVHNSLDATARAVIKVYLKP
jgi:hypothetical protein